MYGRMSLFLTPSRIKFLASSLEMSLARYALIARSARYPGEEARNSSRACCGDMASMFAISMAKPIFSPGSRESQIARVSSGISGLADDEVCEGVAIVAFGAITVPKVAAAATPATCLQASLLVSTYGSFLFARFGLSGPNPMVR